MQKGRIFRFLLKTVWKISAEIPAFSVVEKFVFWDITPCSPLEVKRLFGGICRPYLQGRRISKARNQREASNRLHGVISQKIELFITSAVRTSNHTFSVVVF
jgi:hypothetical protein